MNIHNLITTENVALLSVIITLLIFILSRQAEVRYKKHEDKKKQYIKHILEISVTPGMKQKKILMF